MLQHAEIDIVIEVMGGHAHDACCAPITSCHFTVEAAY